MISDTSKKNKHIVGDIFKILAMLLIVFPFYWMFITAFKTYAEAIRQPPTFWPESFSLQGMNSIFGSRNINVGNYCINSVLITVIGIIIQLIIMVPAAYAFAKYNFFGRNILFSLVLIALMIPGQVTYITIYLTMADWKLLDTLWPQILPFAANAFGIFLLRQAFMQMPNEIIESAKIDGAKIPTIILRILLPMNRSVLFTVILFSFVGTWNNYFWPLVMTHSDEVRPLTMLLVRVMDSEVGTKWNEIMAANLLVILPVLLVYIFASQQIVKAFTYNGIK